MNERWLFILLATASLQAVASCAKPSAGSAATAVTVDEKGFSPNSVSVAKDARASLVFTRTTDDTCAREVVFPEINLTKSLPLNTPVTIDLPTEAARTLTFQCGMAMYKSKVVIR